MVLDPALSDNFFAGKGKSHSAHATWCQRQLFNDPLLQGRLFLYLDTSFRG
jgi:catalase